MRTFRPSLRASLKLICGLLWIYAVTRWSIQTRHAIWGGLFCLWPARALGWHLGFPGAILSMLASGAALFLPSLTKDFSTEWMAIPLWLGAVGLFRAQEKKQLQTIQQTDVLTSLFNRQGFESQLDRMAQVLQLSRQRTPANPPNGSEACCVVACLDGDNFKEFNDTQGHRAGDQLLIHIADALAQDWEATHLQKKIAGRLGGDEFCVAWICSDVREISGQVEQLRNRVENVAAKFPLQTTWTIGLASFTFLTDAARMVDAADRLLLQGKQSGKNRLIIELNPVVPNVS